MVLSFTSCEENFDETTTIKKTSNGFKIINYDDPTLNARGVNINSILSFQTQEDYYATLDSLETEYNNYSDYLLQTFEGLDGEQITDKINAENIDLEQPLTNFESSHNFISLRNAVDAREKVWLLNPNPDFNTCPQMHSIPTFSERSLWNERGEIMVEGKIYKYTEDNTRFIKIEDGDLAKLLLINAGDDDIFDNSMIDFIIMDNQNNQPIITNSPTIQCTGQSYNYVTTNPAFNCRVVTSNRLRIRDWDFGKYSLSAGTVFYKKIGDFYSRSPRRMQVTLQGQRYNNCGNTPTLVEGLNKFRVNSAVSVELKRDYKITTKYNNTSSSINSYHYVDLAGLTTTWPYTFETTMRLKY